MGAMDAMTDQELMVEALRFYRNRLKEQRDASLYMIKNRKWFEHSDAEVARLQAQAEELDRTINRLEEMGKKYKGEQGR